ncbi:MAG TPA: MFS transporter [Candidatus Peribacterales bacterium]|nr:MFS transporter [Candidatus Peribacterales bacterium]
MHRNIRLLLGSSIFIHMGLNILAPVYAIYVQRIGGQLIDASFSIGFYALLRGILYFVFAKFNDKHLPHRPILFSGYMMYTVAYLAYIIIDAPIWLFVIQGWLALADTILNPSWSTVIATSLQTGQERATYAKFYGYRSMFEALGAFLGGIAIVSIGFSWTFAIMALFATCSAFLALSIRTGDSLPLYK